MSTVKKNDFSPLEIMNDNEFEEIRKLFTELTGNKLSVDKKSLVEGRLRKLIINSGLNVRQYIKSVRDYKEVRSEFISSLTTHKTDWFRETPHFGFLKKVVLEKRKVEANHDWKIWSAASSTGEELYSLIMTMHELSETKTKFFGTDISDDCLLRASHGVYAKEIVEQQVPKSLIVKYFKKTPDENRGFAYKFNEESVGYVKWRNFNLIKSDLGVEIEFDFIFLRNVLIYFSSEDGFMIANRLLKYLKKGGYLVIGLSESISSAERLGLKRAENSVYKKI